MPSQPLKVHTYYRSNIPARLVEAQKAVFDHFGIELVQCLDDTRSHAQWLHKTLSEAQDGAVVIADIDAFPLNRGAVETMAEQARGGALAGLAQVANHKNPDKIYAGPMFMALQPAMFESFGRPDLEKTDRLDVAQILTDKAEAAGIPVSLTYPRFAIQPKWALADKGVFGVGTFYGEMDFFHLFQSRHKTTVTLFEAVARDTIKGRYNYAEYLETLAPKKRFKLF